MTEKRFQSITLNDLDNYRARASVITDAAWPESMLHDPSANEN